MNSLLKKLIALTLIFGLAGSSTVAVAGAYAYYTIDRGLTTGDFGDHGFGSLGIYVHEKRPGGVRFGFHLPALLVSTAVAIAPIEIPRPAAERLRPHLPLLRALSQQLESCPDGVFVEVRGPREQVTIEKIDGVFRIHVNDQNEEVRLELPISCVRRALGRVESAIAFA